MIFLADFSTGYATGYLLGRGSCSNNREVVQTVETVCINCDCKPGDFGSGVIVGVTILILVVLIIVFVKELNYGRKSSRRNGNDNKRKV